MNISVLNATILTLPFNSSIVDLFRHTKEFDITETKSKLKTMKLIVSGMKVVSISNFTDAIHSIECRIKLKQNEEIVIKTGDLVLDTGKKEEDSDCYKFTRFQRNCPLILFYKRNLKYPHLDIAIKKGNRFYPIEDFYLECYYMIFSERFRMKIKLKL